MVKILLYASVEIILGAIILYFDLKVFLLYFLIIYFINSHLRTESLLNSIGAHHLSSAIAVCALTQKLGITEEELEDARSKLKAKINRKTWGHLLKVMEDSHQTT